MGAIQERIESRSEEWWTLIGVRECLQEVRRYIPNPEHSGKALRGICARLTLHAMNSGLNEQFYLRMAGNVWNAQRFMIVNPDAARGYIDGVCEEIAWELSRLERGV